MQARGNTNDIERGNVEKPRSCGGGTANLERGLSEQRKEKQVEHPTTRGQRNETHDKKEKNKVTNAPT